MNCSEFLASFSEYYDGSPESPERLEGERHIESCESCARYARVVDRGVSLLRAMPAPEPGPRFLRRLEHRILHVIDEERSRHGSSSALPMATVLGMVILLSVVAWSPAFLDTTPEVELTPIVVSEPPPAARRFTTTPPAFLLDGDPRPLRVGEELFDDPTALFYLYSPLRARYENGRYLRRAGLD